MNHYASTYPGQANMCNEPTELPYIYRTSKCNPCLNHCNKQFEVNCNKSIWLDLSSIIGLVPFFVLVNISQYF